MTSEFITLDPEFEALLREAAAQPGSTLLRVPRPKVLRSFHARAEPVSEHATGLRAVERELLRVYRYEAADFLRQAALQRLLETPQTKYAMNRYGSEAVAVRTLEPCEFVQRGTDLEVEWRSVSAADETPQGLPKHEFSATRDSAAQAFDQLRDILLRYNGSSAGPAPSATDLATLSLKFQPTNHARLIASIDLSQKGAPWTGLKLAYDVLDLPLSATDHARAWQHVGAALVQLEDLHGALDAYRNGCARHEWSITNLLNRVMFALQLGIEHEVANSSEQLDEVISEEHPALKSFVQSQVETRRQGRWTPRAVGVDLARRMGDSLGMTGRRIADVLV